jgi:hypothetical protein
MSGRLVHHIMTGAAGPLVMAVTTRPVLETVPLMSQGMMRRVA